VESAAAAQVGIQADHSCLRLLLACKASLFLQQARPAKGLGQHGGLSELGGRGSTGRACVHSAL